MRLEPFWALYPTNRAGAEKLARLDWPSRNGALAGFDFLEATSAPALLAYRICRGGKADVWGLIGQAPSQDYVNGLVMQHEETLVETVRVRREYLAQTQMHTGPVLLAGRGAAIEEALDLARNETQVTEPIAILAGPGRTDTLWALDAGTTSQVQVLLAKAEKLLIADGHHRAKATAAACSSMLVALFAEKDFSVGACERLISSVPSRQCLAEKILRTGLEVTPSNGAAPGARHAKLWDGTAWHDIDLGHAPQLTSDSRLLQDKIFSPVLGICDPTTDQCIVCLPACADPRELEAQAKNGKVVFRLCPQDLETVYQMASKAQLMPPKTTWFEPKPLPGIVAGRA